MDDAGRSAAKQANNLRRPRPRPGSVLGWATAGYLTATAIHPQLGIPGAITGAIGAALLTSTPDLAAARRWEAGAAGERATAALLAPLAAQGWALLHDRAIPGTKANIDHLVVGPAGQVAVIDSKQWRRGATVRTTHGRLHCGVHERHHNVERLQWEAQHVARTLGVPTTAVMAIHGAHTPNGQLRIGKVTVVAPERLLPVLRAITSTGHPGLAAAAALAYPPYH